MSQGSPQISISFNLYDNVGGQVILNFGLDQTATDGIDIHLGESDLPPYPPTGAFDGRFLLPENNFIGTLSSLKDFRFASGFPFSGTTEHRLRYQGAEGATIMYFGYNFPQGVSGLLQDLVGGVIINVQITGSGIYELNNFTVINQLKLFIYYDNIVTGFDNDERNNENYFLSQNYPNPFNPITTIIFSMPEDQQIILSIHNVLGERVAEIKNEILKSGLYEVRFDASDLPAGIYFYRMVTSDFVQNKKMVLLK